MANFYAFYPPGASTSNASVGVNGSPAPASSTEIGFIDGSSNLQPVTSTNPLPVTSTTLPPGAATAANQSTQIGLETTTNTAVVALNTKGMAALLTKPYDELDITYVGATTDIATVVSKKLSVVQQTLTLSYDGSDRLSSIMVS